MSDLIIWKNDDGVLQVTHPAYNCGLSVDEIAKKDLPSGTKYKIRTNPIKKIGIVKNMPSIAVSFVF